MIVDVKFEENEATIDCDFEEIQYDDKGYERGLAEGEQIGYANGYGNGYEQGVTEGYANGEADTLAKRTELTVTGNGEYTPEGESTGFSKVNVRCENKLNQLVTRTLTEITAADLDGVTNIPQYAFHGCSSIVRAEIPYGVTEIHNYAFQQCSNLAEISFPNGLTRIGNRAFQVCKKLEAVDIPSTVTSIEGAAFQSCSKLKIVKVRAEIPPTISSDTFSQLASTRKFFVNAGSVDAYKTATNWSAQADYIFPLEE